MMCHHLNARGLQTGDRQLSPEVAKYGHDPNAFNRQRPSPHSPPTPRRFGYAHFAGLLFVLGLPAGHGQSHHPRGAHRHASGHPFLRRRSAGAVVVRVAWTKTVPRAVGARRQLVAAIVPLVVAVERLRSAQWAGMGLAFVAVAYALKDNLVQGAAQPLLGERWPDSLSVFAWVSLGVQVLVGGFASFLVWMWLLGRYPATKLSSFVFLTPVFALLTGSLWLNEPVTLGLLLALFGVGAGIVLVNRKSP
jgi:EamA-like transporter family